MERLNYQEHLEKNLETLSLREKRLTQPIEGISSEEAGKITAKLLELNFVKCPAGKVIMGADEGLRCTIEGTRSNETPKRSFAMDSFYISKVTVTNREYEKFDTRHQRTNTSSGDNHPVTCLTYGRAISYVSWLNEQMNLNFSLPTEPQITKAVAPVGWEYPYQEKGKAFKQGQNVFGSFPELYPSGEYGATLAVDDIHVQENYLGIKHATGNVSIFTLGHFYANGHWGASTDGAYVVVVGGNFRLCAYGSRSVNRGIMDIAAVSDTVGIRLVHPDPYNYVKK